VTRIKNRKRLPRRVFRRPKRRRVDAVTACAAGGAMTTIGMLLFSAGWIVSTYGGHPVGRQAPRPAVMARAIVAPKPAPPRIVISAPKPVPAPPVVPRVKVFHVVEAPLHEVTVVSTPLGSRAAYMPLIRAIALRHALPPSLVEAVTIVESDFNRLEVSNKGARGLMQVMPETAARFGVKAEELFDPEKNLTAGAKYLNWLLERYHGNVDLALAAYNAGENAVDTYGGIPPYRETQVYVRRVLQRLREIARRDVLQPARIARG
jgi:soluble lytic murein transglycosylase-like protein